MATVSAKLRPSAMGSSMDLTLAHSWIQAQFLKVQHRLHYEQ
jgi:hypothetical protein